MSQANIFVLPGAKSAADPRKDAGAPPAATEFADFEKIKPGDEFQFSKAITPSSVNLVRSHPSPASRRPSFLQFGTILANKNRWNSWRSGERDTTAMASLAGTPMRSQTSC